MYRAKTVREMKRDWDKERSFLFARIDELLGALLLSTGKDVPEQMLPHQPTPVDEEALRAMHDFVPPLEVYDLN